MHIPFNHDWLFIAAPVGDDIPDGNFQPVTLPHTNKLLPHHNFDDADYQFISTYRKRFTLPEPPNGRRVIIDFEGAMLAATVTVNGHIFPEHKGGFTPFSYDLTDYLDPTGENRLTVHLDSRERSDIPPFGGVVDYLTFGGIYREVHLRYVDPLHIENVFFRCVDLDTRTAEIDVWITNQDRGDRAVTVGADLNEIQSSKESLILPAGEAAQVTLSLASESFALWSIDQPNLYQGTVYLTDDEGRVVDSMDYRTGFRQAEFKDDGYYLNGEKIKLVGLNRHQIYPYIGAAAPARLQRKDADIVKFELGCNIVRTSHYPQSRHFLDRCDEIGLLVFEEIPGWQHIGDADWQALSMCDVRDMIERDRNHPSIVIWGVRINESFDNTEFYTETNRLAHELDPTRQTGGVRFWQYSEFLEDVYTYNDFSNAVEEPEQTPHLVTEFNGHMFPTKTWDNEERQIEHALRHARIQDKQMGMENVTGAIGWCAFDYNTHKEFGSGDRVCYHGVMDMFRLPKYAGYFYASQVDPAKRVVLQAATVWSMGDRSGGGNNPLTVFSNCDEIEVFIGDNLHGRFPPDRETFPHLPHPPFTVPMEMMWGQAFADLRLVGYWNGEVVAEQRIAMDGQPAALIFEADDVTLRADGMDMTRLVVKVVDRFGNRLPYAHQVVMFEVQGPAHLLGENPLALVGGQAAVYLRAGIEAGEVTVRAWTPRFTPVEADIVLIE